MSSFTLLNASAGSGKTHRITLEFLKIILPAPAEASRILSITFTNKAAGEMKERVISSLAELSANPAESKMLADLLAAFPQKTQDDISRQATEALKYILHHYSDIAISTIDSFMQRIIRTFARELQLPANYEVTVGDDELNELIISNIIDNANLDDNITRVLKEIILMQMDEERNPLRLADELTPLVNHLSQEASIQIVDQALETGTAKMISSFDFLLRKNRSTYITFKKNLDTLQKILVDNNLVNDDFIKYRNATSIFNYIGKLQKSYDASPLTPVVYDMLVSGKFLKEPNPQLESEIRDLLLATLDLISDYTYGRMMARRFPVVALLSEIWRFREQYKTENSVLPVSDFNRIIREVLSKEPVPFIYLRAGSRYKTIMIDEFQDTSLMQWLNLLPLIHESLARGNASWVVGDPKQSIYRWRNGKVEIMLSLPEIFEGSENSEEIEEMIKRSFSEDNLQFNYRSDINIVNFNSSFFGFIKDKFNKFLTSDEYSQSAAETLGIYSRVYNQIEQKQKQSNKGYVECRLYNGKLKEHIEKWLNDILDVINDCRQRGYKLSDIVILSRKNSVGVAISSFLMGLPEPVPVISRETLQFRTSPHCRLAMCLYRLIHCPDDDLNAAETWVLLQQYTTVDFTTSPDLQNFFLQKNTRRGRMLLGFITEKSGIPDRASLAFLPPVDQLDLIIHSLEISDNGGFFLLFLREQLMKQQEKTGFDSDLLWQWWTEKGQFTSVIVPDAGDAVNVMTIHSSKGLQFPVVIIPDFNINETKNLPRNLFWHNTDEKKWGIPYSVINYSKSQTTGDLEIKYQVENAKSIMDTINLMYVGTTRAEEKLFVFCSLPPEKQAKESSRKKKAEPEEPVETPVQTDSAKSLRDFVRSGLMPFNERTDEAFSMWWMGDISEKRSRREKADNRFEIKTFRVNPNKPLDSLRKSKSAFDSRELRESAGKGKIIHELLSRINDATDIEPVVSFYTSNGWIEENKKPDYIRFLGSVVNDYPFIFPGREFILSEREIAGADGAVWRPDRIVIGNGNRWKVIDFKTGREKTEHKKQVKLYANLLSEAGMTVESSHIIYIDTESFSASLTDVL